jgi:hypothetical protein
MSFTYSPESEQTAGIVNAVVRALTQTEVWKWAKAQMLRSGADRPQDLHDEDDGDLWEDEPDLDPDLMDDETFDDEGHDLAEDELDLEEAEEELADHQARNRHEEPIREGRRRIDPSAAARKFAARFSTPGRRAPQSHGMRPRLTESTPSSEMYGEGPGDEQEADQWTDLSGRLPKKEGGYPTYCPEDADGEYDRGHDAGRPADHYAKAREAQKAAADAARRWVSREDHHVGRDAAGRYLADDYDGDDHF